MKRVGGNAQDRRRVRRAGERRTEGKRAQAIVAAATISPEELADIGKIRDDVHETIVASASGSTSLPLSDQDTAWDAAAAEKSLDAKQFGDAHFWRDPDGPADEIGSYKLPFASASGGKLTAIWKGVVAAAGAIQGARGGVKIPSGDVAGIKAKIGSYYSKAAKQFGDDQIKVPWAAVAEASIRFASEHGLDLFTDEDGEYVGVGGDFNPVDLVSTQTAAAAAALAYAEVPIADSPEYQGRLGFWIEELGGKPKPGTSPDKRLKKNKMEPEDSALERLDATFAIGDVAWGPEEGFVDLLCDVNEALGASEGTQSDAMETYSVGPRAIDASVTLDKVLICDQDGDGYYVAPIKIGDQGDPVVAPRAEWIPVEQGWVEAADDDAPVTAATMRFSLQSLVFASADKVDLPDAHKPGAKMPKKNASPMTPAPPAGASANPLAWTAIFVPEGTLTDDGRAFAPESLTWRDLPLSLMAMTETSAEGGHDGAKLSGRIDSIWRDGTLLRASGMFDEGEFGLDIARMVGDRTLSGLSVDIAIHEFEVGPKTDYFDADGHWLIEKPEPLADTEEPSLEDRLFGPSRGEDDIFVVTKGVIGMATVCPFPAFAEASISLQASGAIWSYTAQAMIEIVEGPAPAVVASGEPILDADGEEIGSFFADGDDALTASAAGLAPLLPPIEWFANPNLEELSPISVDAEGRISGHAWGWSSCHTGIPNVCTTAPHSNTNYAYFHVGEIECENGETVSVGRITFDTGHADKRLTRAAAASHYDDTGKIGAYVVVGEDEFGGWVAGTLAPHITAEDAQKLRGSAPSGDWRDVNGQGLELIALLSVNVPGFPVPRPRSLVASIDDHLEVLSLTAAGIEEIYAERTPEDDFAAIGALADTARGSFEDLRRAARG